MIIETSSYGLCLFSVLSMNNFLTNQKKQRTKKVLDLFQKNKKMYIESLIEGVWIPIVNIPSVEYKIEFVEKEQNYDCAYQNYNLEITDDELWICDIGKFHKFDESEFRSKDELSYYTLDNQKIISGFRVPIKNGKYSVSIYSSKTNNIPCFSFKLSPVEEFNQFNDPREIIFKF